MSEHPVTRLLQNDPMLVPYKRILRRRFDRIQAVEKTLTQGKMTLCDFASAHEYFGLHFRNNEWIFREWAPNATAVYLIGNMTDWSEKKRFLLDPIDRTGVWQICLPPDALNHNDLYRLRIHWKDGAGDRIPAYARRVVQDPETHIFSAQVWRPPTPYTWRFDGFRRPGPPLYLYEAHVGMAQEAEKIGTFKEFSDEILPRIVSAGYNALQLMAVQEHPYYGSFGYQVSNFFAASSRFGTPDDLKELIDMAHAAGLVVIMDIIHSHAVSNEVEGLSRFDGTTYQYFHEGERGHHRAWDSRCFDYSKYQVLHFLLSNCRYWLDEYHFDGFRFDGVTSMLYLHHGLNKAFTCYEDYFNGTVDEDAYTYLALANKVIHEIRTDGITIAEDISGMPGLAVPISDGGAGFDYRFAMGISDNWIRLIKDLEDHHWHTGDLWYELTNRRKDEKSISYSESHDQALVGDQTLIFRLIGSDMYTGMAKTTENIRVDRGIALHKLIRFITLATAGDGYLNFMGNEFGHPEWIDFPRPGNNWSFQYARRQWHLVDDPNLRYQFLARFDRDMLSLSKKYHLLEKKTLNLLFEHSEDKILFFERAGLYFVFCFHPTRSYFAYRLEAPPGKYKLIFNSDSAEYGGHNRLTPNQFHLTLRVFDRNFLNLYLPTRTAIVLSKID